MGISKKPLISICIPTYNRPNEFERMFNGLLPQITEEIEIVIRDDSSNLETKEIFERLIDEKSVNYQYFKGEKIGLDAANLFLLENATGKYIWWFSDDDEFLPGAISRTLELVKKYPEITFIFINFGFEKIGNLAIDRKDGFFWDGKEVLEVVGANIGLLSSLFLRREDALPSLSLAKKYIKGFSFAALIPVFYNLSGTGRFYFLRGAYVLHLIGTKIRIEEIKKIAIAEGKIRNEYFDYFGIDFYNILKEFEYKFGKKFVRKILAKNFSSLWRGILVGWVGGWDTPKGKRWKMFKLYWNFPEFWIALIPFLSPLWVNKLMYKIYKLFFSHRKFILGENLKYYFKK